MNPIIVLHHDAIHPPAAEEMSAKIAQHTAFPPNVAFYFHLSHFSISVFQHFSFSHQ